MIKSIADLKHRMGPLGQFGLVVTISVHMLYVGMYLVPFPCDSPREAKEVPGEHRGISTLKNLHKKMYIITTESPMFLPDQRGAGLHEAFQILSIRLCVRPSPH